MAEQGKPGAPRTNEQLMQAFCNGSTDSFNQLFSRYKNPIFGFFSRRLSEPFHADELTQETFLAVLRGSSRYETRALFRTYLYAVAFKILRAHKRKAAFRATFFGNPAKVHEAVSPGSIDTAVFIHDAMAKLELTHREILLLQQKLILQNAQTYRNCWK